MSAPKPYRPFDWVDWIGFAATVALAIGLLTWAAHIVR